MSDDTNNGFVPEPIPDHLADTEVNGLDPVQADETAPVEDTSEDTAPDQPEDEQPEAEATEDEPLADEPEEAPTDVVEEEPEQPDARELARQRFERSQQAKAQRDYIQEQRQQIREYETDYDRKVASGELDEITQLKEETRIIRAQQYIDSVERNRQAIARDATLAKTEIPFFKAATPQAELLYEQSLQNFANAYGVTDPDTGEWIAAQDRNGNEVQLLPYLQQQAAIYEQALSDSTRQVQKTEAKMRAKAVNPSNVGKTTSSGDELADLLDKIGDMPLN